MPNTNRYWKPQESGPIQNNLVNKPQFTDSIFQDGEENRARKETKQ